MPQARQQAALAHSFERIKLRERVVEQTEDGYNPCVQVHRAFRKESLANYHLKGVRTWTFSVLIC